ncbi:glycosyltransferase family 24 protein [Trametes versicolor FP-101664 SS1]|uniref:glycosyltransferase family 24 protein n=1 Tax=Trametes versicolor (strain FP-101664) TaxID=717944 RepID=UPI0004622249|nr:glycosyltransferase family 24 protein [Trametes versicolor FP-101664 SS1]EIW54691.1 glycosyltransferase family 24 protein [Trametes versicolor FP-101664 SS1]
MLRLLPLLTWPLLRTLAGSPPVNIELRTSWPAAPILLESIEAVSIEDPDAFFPLLHAVTDASVFPLPSDKSSPAHAHQHVLETALALDFLAEPGAYVSAEMHVALHSASPKLEAFYQYYTDHHATRTEGRTSCGSWVDWYGEVVCDVETLANLVQTASIDAPGAAESHTAPASPRLLAFDHVLPDPARVPSSPPHTAVLYASLESPNFHALHSYLYAAASAPTPRVAYVFRPVPPADRDLAVRSHLSGYGVALDLKKMDYLAVDDRLQGGSGSSSDEGSTTKVQEDEADIIVTRLQQYPADESVDVTAPLTDTELLDIGLQATQLVYDAEEPHARLATLKQLAQNFPRFAGALARRVTVNESLLNEVAENQAKAPGGANAIWLNGAAIEEKDMNPFGLLKAIRKERGTILSLMALGLNSTQAVDLLTHRTIAQAQASGGVLDGLFDASDRAEGGEVIGWLNDIENDERYASWGGNLKILLRQLYPGQFPTVKYNLFNIVLAADLSQASSVDFIGGTVNSLIRRGLPFRWGVAPLVETEDGARMARLFYYLLEVVGADDTLGFLLSISQRGVPMDQVSPSVVWSQVRTNFEDLLAAKENLPEGIETDFDTIIAGGEGDLDAARTYATRLSATLSTAPQGHVFFNGKHFDLDDTFLQALQMEFSPQLQHLQYKIYKNELTEEQAKDMSTYFYDLPTTAKRRNTYIHPTQKAGSLRIYSLPELIERNGLNSTAGVFVYPTDSELVPLTTYVVADFDSEKGREFVKEAIKSVTPGSLSRLSFIHSPSSQTPILSGPSSILARLITADALFKISPERLLSILGLNEATEDAAQQPLIDSADSVLADLPESVDAYEKYVDACRLVVRSLGLKSGELAVIVNGRVVGPIAPGEFIAGDFESLAAYEHHKRVQPVYEALLAVHEPISEATKEDAAEIISIVSSVLSSIQQPDPSEAGLFDAPQKPRLRNYRRLTGEYTAFTIGDEETALFQIGAIINPLGQEAQKWTSLLEWLSGMPGVYIEVHVNPMRHTEIPLKRFYRYNLLPRLAFDEEGNEIHAKTQFTNLPTEPIYTLAMDAPQSWLIRPKEAVYDLDNIQLGLLSPQDRASGLNAVFDLDALVVEGHAREGDTSAPPRGLQMQLVTSDATPIADTLVMANLGYLQFRTKPGVYRLEIRPGRGREIFEMESVGNEGWNSPGIDEAGDVVTVTSFEGVTLYPRLARLPGMEREDVLRTHAVDAGDEHAGVIDHLVNKVSSLFGGKKEEKALVAVDDGQADINIFTVASGHLYERFASIMILSVLRHTKSSVKFWFIDNFLSPSFLEFLPKYAAEYGFQYELVTYKWPTWLRAQTEKQRIIWAYKILFLDVLFPMDLKKVLFVDADQIVRADLQELVDIDLRGRPYGYVPMGNDNPDTEGFRFWKTGYWKDFLRGMPYHISALYVVDLVRFRQLAAGDMLRGHYQALSADPNSLANLDQDLPNNLQREVPIYSLPEDWLWCETWCSKDRLDRAKTIDLCQNPLTKEPKLDRAKQIPEWEVYDAEISAFAKRLTASESDAERPKPHDEL